ncbi:apolipoprotein N-acyltransferase [Aestuariibacter sp. AA17]|uniref:Apolipoprotein N-acyltransferase n=1 Tax=Fluctibacter corallii TaxID=2984329 RepID=A0ABT3ABE1_9ALTE|nr:apolipoprotein N-acyltransferase [Aestuariibacter sp. AA17]MCV2885943.1 apolipoprotein N-acyltransferase [Aestuariibacter sp. AA17]
MKPAFHYGAALLSGSALTLAYAPFNFWWLTLPCFALFSYLLLGTSPKQAAKTGMAFGLGWFGAGISWVHVSIAEFGGLPLIGSIGLMLLLCAYLALYPTFFAYALQRSFSRSIWPLSAAALWFVVEWFRSWMLTGFPWLSIGYSQTNGPLAGWLPVIGETGLSALLVLCASALALGVKQRNYYFALSPALITLITGAVFDRIDWVTPTNKTASVALVQGNIKQELRWVPEQDRPTMEKYLRMTEAHWRNDIIVWPEAAIPKLEPLARNYIRELDELAIAANTSLITGIVNYNFETSEAFNNVIVVGKQRQNDTQGHYRYLHVNRYAKHHLLPIGEFIPFEDWLRGIAPLFDLPMSSFSRGDYQQANLMANGYRLAPALCFEIAFPRQIGANLHKNSDMIITVSNDAWFGHSHGPAQHMQIAQVRAKEFGMPVIRATNNGITGIIDASGNIQSLLPQFEAAVLTDSVSLVTGNTPYRWLGDLPMWIFTFLALVSRFFFSRTSTHQ